MIEKICAEQIIPYLQEQKIILAFGNEAVIQRTADSFAALGIPKENMFGLIGQNAQIARAGLDIDHTFVAIPEASLAFELREYHKAIANLGAEHIVAINTFDPEKKAVVIGAFWFCLSSVAGRHVLGYRRPSWILYEDKCAVSEIWYKAGITQAKSEVVPVHSLHSGLPQGWAYPVVVSGDSLNGITGGGSHVRYVESDTQMQNILSFFALDCAQVRLMEYIDGISCSMHGFVLEDTVCTSIPIEMLVVPNSRGKFIYMGAATHWEPIPAETSLLEDSVRNVGVALREEVGFRGTFTLDGILKGGVFYPTEINTRSGAGIFALYGAEHTKYYLLDVLIKDGQNIDWAPSDIEHWMQETAKKQRSRRAWGAASIEGECPNETHPVSFLIDTWCTVEEDEHDETATKISISAGREGAFLMMSFAEHSLSKGELLNPYVQAAMKYSDAIWKTKFLR